MCMFWPTNYIVVVSLTNTIQNCPYADVAIWVTMLLLKLCMLHGLYESYYHFCTYYFC